MKLTMTLQDSVDATQSTTLTANSTTSLVLASGAESRTVDPGVLGRAVQNALNVGPKGVPGFVAETTVPENPAGKTLTVTNHTTDRTLVVLGLGTVTRTHNGAELQKAIRVSQQP